MPDVLKLNARIDIEGSPKVLRVGANPQPPNKFILSIKNEGELLPVTPDKCLYLRGCLGSSAKALFLDDADARKCTKSKPNDWEVVWDFSGKEQGWFRLKIFSFRPLAQGQELMISFSSVISKTSPDGAAALFFETDFSDAVQDLTIPKTALNPDIISFTAEPPEGVQNLPGDQVILKWRTVGLTNRELSQIGIADPLACDFRQDEGQKAVSCAAADTTFRLTGYDGPKAIFRDLQLKVLTQGWYDIRNTVWEGDPGYPGPRTENEARLLNTNRRYELEPTLLFNANNKCLYAIFRRKFAGREKGFVFKTENPFGGWRLVESSVPDQPDPVPIGFTTSPGIYFDDKLWLIGGSQIDPDNTANDVWCFDPQKSAWEYWGAADWIARMGHAVLAYKNKIWVMGGRDEAGNPLNDVYTLDVASRKWDPLDNAAWEPRCLFNPTVFEVNLGSAGKDSQIWLYGGARGPDSALLYDDLYVYSGGKWEPKEMTGIIQGHGARKPIASCIQVFDGRLCLFGKFRVVDPGDKSEIVEPLGFSLAGPTTKTWERFPSEGLKNWGAETASSYQMVNFRDKMLIAKALSFRKPNAVLKVYVPG